MFQNHCHVASNYCDTLSAWSDRSYYSANVHKMQLPFTPATKPTPVDPEVLKLRRQELAKRLVEINRRRREEKVGSKY
jgi:actin-related protein 5